MEKFSLLLVEDDEDDVFFMKRALKTAGINSLLCVAQNGQRAIDHLKETLRNEDPLPCLILLDLKLPLISGLEVLEWIRQQPELQMLLVVIFTSSKERVDITRAYRLGANSYLVKSSTAQNLLEQVQMIKRYWLEMNQHPCCPEAA